MYSYKGLIIVTVVLVNLVTLIKGAVYSTDDKWILADRTQDLPDEAVLGGFDSDGYINYVGRVYYVNNVLPARVVPELGRATFNTDEANFATITYEVLVSNATVSYQWIRSFDGFREKNAVSVGTNVANERVFVCRIRCAGGVFIGTLYPSKRRCIVKYDNLQLYESDKYEILVRQRQVAPFMPFAL